MTGIVSNYCPFNNTNNINLREYKKRVWLNSVCTRCNPSPIQRGVRFPQPIIVQIRIEFGLDGLNSSKLYPNWDCRFVLYRLFYYWQVAKVNLEILNNSIILCFYETTLRDIDKPVWKFWARSLRSYTSMTFGLSIRSMSNVFSIFSFVLFSFFVFVVFVIFLYISLNYNG